MAVHRITPVFVEFIPENIEQGKLYISETYKTAIHKCCCGCGEEVVTPLSPADWQLKKGVNTVSLYPSIGNWNYECKSHYFISNNKIIWARKFNQKQIQAVQTRDRMDKQRYIEQKNKVRPTTMQRTLNWFINVFQYIKSFLGTK
ncbi:DUF6527 family protein [Shewanella algae]|uniref:DUF6527 family protein n=1 Tax=Shewanella algae TaxID=38313 RepID=UPI001C90CDB3|nr:DUF6527 family protein [Shewanella algae]TVO80516.1 hypothetical protein AYI78_19295 [Shewanella algae]TVO83441.1 hypothetical protein AYI76_11695 [Shewanella algae]TVO98170.1 hypothetical protein AYI79_05740 [Shewanella algae]